MERKKTRCVSVGGVVVGGGSKVSVQTMTTTKSEYVELAVNEIQNCIKAGADIVRVAVRDEADAKAIKSIKDKVNCPIVADIHFSPKLAILSAENGADKLRINPGNIGGKDAIKAVSDCVKAHKIPVRAGSNSGSIEKTFLEKYGRSARALAESALYSASVFEKNGVGDIVISAKASDVKTTVEAYELLSEKCDYPLHLGVTEAGTINSGLIKGAVGIGSLLLRGIGDTVRVSLSAPPVEEVFAAKRILRAAGIDTNYVEVVSCPTCGRCDYDVFSLAEKVEKTTQNAHKRLKVAVMGCVVNGVGEGRDADLGIAGGKEECIIFSHGEILRKVATPDAEKEFLKEIEKCLLLI